MMLSIISKTSFALFRQSNFVSQTRSFSLNEHFYEPNDPITKKNKGKHIIVNGKGQTGVSLSV